MKCPRDGTALARLKILGVEIDKCHRCDGIWCDPGELERIRDAKQSRLEEEIERIYGNPKIQPGSVDGYMRCPRCSDGRLQQFTYTFQKPVRLDRCEKCFGIWLDDRELDTVIEEKRELEPGEDTRARRTQMLLWALARNMEQGTD
jgi:Zn-finger nucleic acid-binding protein